MQESDQIIERSPKQRFIRFNDQIGKGTYKTVYRGYDEESGCEIAWNVIDLDQLPHQEKKRISEELNILNNIKHPNIISFINAWMNKQKNEVIFITEIIHGGSLKKHLRKIQRPRMKILKHWCREILKGLDYLHSIQPNPIIHRDIKCDNIFINTHNNQLRIGDLGLAITLKQQDFTKSILGTPEFMAPEIYEEKYGTPVDIYAFGMTTLEIASQRKPYEECNTPAQIYKKVIGREKPKQLDLIQNDKLKQFILRCLEDQSKRPTAAELLNDSFLQEQEDDNQHIELLPEVQQCQKIQIIQQLEQDNSLTIHLKDNQEYQIKITFTQFQSDVLDKIQACLEPHLRFQLIFEKFEQDVMQIEGVQSVKKVKWHEENKRIIKQQLMSHLQQYDKVIQNLQQDLSQEELEQIELELLNKFQQLRKQKQ